jgi:penicillin-binding protein 2
VQRDTDRRSVFTRRSLLLGGLQVGMVTALVGRLYQLQVLQANHYRTMAEDNRVNLRLLVPPRGPIFDRNNVQLAGSQQNFRAVLVAEQTKNVPETLDRMAGLIDLTETERARILRDVRRRRRFVPVSIREDLSWAEVAKLEVNAPDLPGVAIEVGMSRLYPLGVATAHLLGYVAKVAEAELTGDPLLELPEFRIGKNGVERQHDTKLRGKAGAVEVEVNAIGRIIRELERKEGQPGDEIHLALDSGLQVFASERFGVETGAAVVLDVHTGEVLTLASVPSYDPHLFYHGIRSDVWRDLNNNPKTPLINKAISGQYAPGSTFKMVVALAALETNAIQRGGTVFCPGFTTLGDARFHCWRKEGHGYVDMRDGIKQSCDVYFYEVARRVGLDRIAEMANRLGLGRATAIDLPGERPGLIPTREWKEATLGDIWHPGETLVAGIGQGYITATPLQLALMLARMVNGGYMVTPRLARVRPDEAKRERTRVGISPRNLEVMIEAMMAVVNEPRGTALGARIREPEFAMGGKTGTSQVRRISRAERATGIRKGDQVPWHLRDHALFVGFAPLDKPRFACAVVVEHGGGGAAVAAPIARDILLEAQKRNPAGGQVRPLASNDPPPRSQP